MTRALKKINDELIVLVDQQGNSIGTAPKLASHNATTPLHLGFSCYVFNHKGQFLLTQRAKSKKVFPGVWTNTCCGHPGPSEKTEDAIKRRLKNELGLEVKKLKVALPNFRYKAAMNGVVENEICPVYIAVTQGEPRPNPDEVEGYTWVDWKEFIKKIETNPGDYSPWATAQVEELKEQNLENVFTGPGEE